jgi:Tfp pilus assembly PilM family ATPase
MLLDIETNWTNFVICRHNNLLFAHSIPIGARQLEGEDAASKLVFEIAGFRHHFSSMFKQAKIERLIFLSGQTVDKDICTTIAKQLEIPAQIGDCLAAVEIDDPYNAGIDKRGCQFSWAAAFGLSLS